MYPRTPQQLPPFHYGELKTTTVADILIASCAVTGRVNRRASLPAVRRSPTSGSLWTPTNGNRPRTSPETVPVSEVTQRPQTSKTRGSSRSASNSASRGSRRPRSVGSTVLGSVFDEKNGVVGTRRNDIWAWDREVSDGDGKKGLSSGQGIVGWSAHSVAKPVVAPVYENLFDFGPRVGFGTSDGGTSILGGDGKKGLSSGQGIVGWSANSVAKPVVAPVYENLFDFGPRVGNDGFGAGDGGTSILGGGGGAGGNAWDFAEVVMYKEMAAKTAELKKVTLVSYPDPVEEEVTTEEKGTEEIEQDVAPEQTIPEEEKGILPEVIEIPSLPPLQQYPSQRNLDDAENVAEYGFEDIGNLRPQSPEVAVDEERPPLHSIPSQKQLTMSLEIMQSSSDPVLSPKENEISISYPALGRGSQRLSFSHSTIAEPIRLGSAGDVLSELDIGNGESVVVKEEKEADREISTPSTPGKVDLHPQASTEQLEILPSLTHTKSGSRSEFDAGYEEYEAELQRQDRALQLEAEETRKREREEAHKKARAQSAVRRNLLIFEKVKDEGKTTVDGSGRVDEFVYSITESDISLTRAERNMVRLQSTMNVNGLLQATHNRQVAGIRQERLFSAREVVAFAHIEEQLGRLAARETRRRQMRAFQAYGRWPGEVPIDLYVQPHDGYHDYGTSGQVQKREGTGRPTTTQATAYATVKVQNKQRQALPPLSTRCISPAPNLLRRPRTTSCMR